MSGLLAVLLVGAVGVRDVALRDALQMLRLGAQLERGSADVALEGRLEPEFVLSVVELFAAVFEEVNAHATPEERRRAFQERSLAAIERLLAGGAANGGPAGG